MTSRKIILIISITYWLCQSLLVLSKPILKRPPNKTAPTLYRTYWQKGKKFTKFTFSPEIKCNRTHRGEREIEDSRNINKAIKTTQMIPSLWERMQLKACMMNEKLMNQTVSGVFKFTINSFNLIYFIFLI